jgi:hypothetical protein
MPLYRFRCVDPYGDHIHALALDLADLDEVRMAALRLAINLRDCNETLRWGGWTIEATDEAGKVVHTATIPPDRSRH